MDRRERYDPEDIEALLAERTFDELLPEERAYVLRHLSGRDEYEAMRTLLRHMRSVPRDQPPIEAHPGTRNAVLEAFRAHHTAADRKPRPRIWLNALAAWLAPPSAGRPWLRPALAFAGLAVLVTVSVWVFRDPGPLAPEPIAEVKAPSLDTRTTSAQEDVPSPGQPTAERAAGEVAEHATEAQWERTLTERSDAPNTPATLAMEPADPGSAVSAMAEVAVVAEVEMDDAVAYTRAEESRSATPAAEPERIYRGRVVSAEELRTNQSLSNASGKVQATAPQKRDQEQMAPRALAQDPHLLGLLVKGW
jgi:hypothetical protein